MATRGDRRRVQTLQRFAKEARKLGLEAKWAQEGEAGEAPEGSPAPPWTNVILVRHGETDWNTSMRIQGHTDVPLNNLGEQQGALVGKHFRDSELPVDAIYASDLSRAKRTADLIAEAVGHTKMVKETVGVPALPDGVLRLVSASQVTCTTAMRERSLGDLEGKTMQEARAACPEAVSVLLHGDFATRIPGGGESSVDVSLRACQFLEELAAKHPGGRVLVVTHGGVVHNLHFLATGAEAPGKIINCGIYEFRVRPPGHPWEVARWGESAHLDEAGYSTEAFGGGARSG